MNKIRNVVKTGLLATILLCVNGLSAAAQFPKIIESTMHDNENIGVTEWDLWDFGNVSLCPYGKFIVTYGGQIIKLWGFQDKNIVNEFDCGEQIELIRFSQDGQFIVSMHKNKKYKLLDLLSGKFVRDIYFPTQFISDDGGMICGGQCKVNLYDFDARRNLVLSNSLGCDDQDVVSPNGKFKVSRCEQKISLSDICTGEIVHQFDCWPCGWHRCPVDISQDHKFMVYCGRGKIELWALNEGVLIYEFIFNDPVLSVKFGLDGEQIIVKLLDENKVVIFTDRLYHLSLQKGVTGATPWKTVFGR